MGILARVRGQKAILREGVWRSADAPLEESLNRITEEWIRETGGPPVGARNPEGITAREILKRTGGRVLLRIPVKSRRSGSVYIALRQYRLPF
jgi:hypothetical protein